MKIAIVDIDGVIVDSVERFKQCTENGKINWDRALSSELLHLDELIPHAVEHLAVIRQHHDHLVLLTSRYDHMRDATFDWLKAHGITAYDRAIFKGWEKERYTKTKLWKAQQVIKLLQEASQTDLWNRLPSLPITELLVVEDEEANQQEIAQEVGRWIMSNRQMRARYFVSLQDAVNAL